MKKRILSLILAVLMVVVLVPAALMPVTAAENAGFTSVFAQNSENWPSFKQGAGLDHYNGNWTVGSYSGSLYTEAVDADHTYNILSSVVGQHWAYHGLYLVEGRAILKGGTTINGETQYLPYMAENSAVKTAFAYNYSAKYEGTVDLSFQALTPYAGGEGVGNSLPGADPAEAAKMYVAVAINGTIIWPVANGNISDPANFALVSKLGELDAMDTSALKDVEVNIGDNISFILARYNTNYGIAEPVVTYHDGYEVVPARLRQSYGPGNRTWPVIRNLGGAGDMIQTDATWTIGDYKASGNVFTEHVAQRRNAADVWTTQTRDDTSYETNSGILLKSGDNISGAYYFPDEAGSAPAPAYKATILATGVAEFTANAANLFIADINQAAMKNATAYVDVYHNARKIGTITIATDAKGVATISSTVTGRAVAKGDEIIFAARPGTGVKTLTATPMIAITDITSFMSRETDKTYDMDLEKTSVVVTDRVGMKFSAFATIQTYKDATAANLYVWDASVANKTAANATVIPMEIAGDFSYEAVYSDFAAKEMVDEVTAQVVVLKDTEVLCESPLSTFTVAAAAQAQFDAAIEQEERDLMAAVMNYGAYAQKYFKYKTDDLANKGLDDFYANIDVDEIQYKAAFAGDPVGQMISASEIKGATLYLDGSLTMRLNLQLDEYEKQNCTIYIQYGKTEEEMLNCKKAEDGLQVDVTNKAAVLENISLQELSDVYYLRLAVQESKYKYYGYQFTYSVESYVARMVESTEAGMPKLLCALMELGNQAK